MQDAIPSLGAECQLPPGKEAKRPTKAKGGKEEIGYQRFADGLSYLYCVSFAAEVK